MAKTSESVLRVFIQNMFVPAIVRAGDLHNSVRFLKQDAVHFVRGRFEADVEIVAGYFGKSTRWIYRVLGQDPDGPGESKAGAVKGRTGSKRGTAGGAKAEVDEAEDGDEKEQYGYPLMCATVEFYRKHHKEPLPIGPCLRALRAQGFKVDASKMEPLFDIYCGMGYLRKLIDRTGGREVVRYQAVQGSHRVLSSADRRERLARVGDRCKVIVPVAEAYVDGVPHTYFSELQGLILMEDYVWAADRIRALVAEVLAEAKNRTSEKDPDELHERVWFRGLYLMGTGPWLEPPPSDLDELLTGNCLKRKKC